jgi:hypothetical protein
VNAFTAVAQDDGGLDSSPPVQATVFVSVIIIGKTKAPAADHSADTAVLFAGTDGSHADAAPQIDLLGQHLASSHGDFLV